MSWLFLAGAALMVIVAMLSGFKGDDYDSRH